MTALEHDMSDKEFEDELNENYGEVEICGLTYAAGYALRQVDPIAFRCAQSDEMKWECSECGKVYGEEQDAEDCCPQDEEIWAPFNHLELHMTLEQAKGASHQGACDEDVKALCQEESIARQLDEIDPEKIRAELADEGAWDDEELADDATNRERIVWIAAGNIVEEQEEK
jgi:hypothetical protein